MASQEQCERSLRALADRLAELDPALVAKYGPRTLSCRLPDIGVTFSGLLTADGLTAVQIADSAAPAQVRATTDSDDLLALVDGRLSPTYAWTSGRLRIEAGVKDLLRLRGLL